MKKKNNNTIIKNMFNNCLEINKAGKIFNNKDVLEEKIIKKASEIVEKFPYMYHALEEKFKTEELYKIAQQKDKNILIYSNKSVSAIFVNSSIIQMSLHKFIGKVICTMSKSIFLFAKKSCEAKNKKTNGDIIKFTSIHSFCDYMKTQIGKKYHLNIAKFEGDAFFAKLFKEEEDDEFYEFIFHETNYKMILQYCQDFSIIVIDEKLCNKLNEYENKWCIDNDIFNKYYSEIKELEIYNFYTFFSLLEDVLPSYPFNITINNFFSFEDSKISVYCDFGGLLEHVIYSLCCSLTQIANVQIKDKFFVANSLKEYEWSIYCFDKLERIKKMTNEKKYFNHDEIINCYNLFFSHLYVNQE